MHCLAATAATWKTWVPRCNGLWDTTIASLFIVDEKGDLNFWERVYVTFSEPGSSVVSKWISLIIMALIILSTASFILDTVPEYKLEKNAPKGYMKAKSLETRLQ